MWAALARISTEELQQRQFAALSDRDAQTLLQGRKLGVARLRLLPKRSGMRFIVNLGKASVVRFPGARLRGAGAAAADGGVGGKRGRRAPAVKLSFRPVNSLLQNVDQVGERVGWESVQFLSGWPWQHIWCASITLRPWCLMVYLLVLPACRCCASRPPASPTCWVPQVGLAALTSLHCLPQQQPPAATMLALPLPPFSQRFPQDTSLQKQWFLSQCWNSPSV